MKRKHIDLICLGDKFKDEYGDIFEVMSFPTPTHVFLECSDMARDTYAFRDQNLLDEINKYYEWKDNQDEN